MDFGIRLISINIKNIKNVANGYIEFDSKKEIEKGNFLFSSSDIVGIYGPNGSSKTALVNAFAILKSVFISSDNANKENSCFHFDSKEVYELIKKDEDEAILELSFFSSGQDKRICFYRLTIGKKEDNRSAFIKKESFSYKIYNEKDSKWNSKVKLIDVSFGSEDLQDFISPLSLLNTLKRDDKSILNSLQRLVGSCSSTNSSFVFSDLFISILNQSKEYFSSYVCLRKMKLYCIHNMHVYDNKEISKIAAFDALPFFYKNETDNLVNTFAGEFNIFGESILPMYLKNVVIEYFEQIDLVINKIITDMHVSVIELGNVLLSNGEEGFKCEVISIRNGIKIPLRLESDGIKKIISLISSLVDIFNNQSSILVVDEFDSGIFEYLLGELLRSIKEEAKGQLVFTSHNLRALEVIKDCIIFSSTDSKDRYISYPRISRSENLRSQYLRKMFLDSDERYSKKIDSYEICRSFVKTGEIIANK